MINPMDLMGAAMPQQFDPAMDPASKLKGLSYEQLLQFNQPFSQQLAMAQELQQGGGQQYTDPLAAALGGLGGAAGKGLGSARENMLLKDMQRAAADQVTAGLNGGASQGMAGGAGPGMSRQAALAALLMGKRI